VCKRGRSPNTYAVQRAERTEWSPDAVLDAIRSWTTQHGRPPRADDWDPSQARRSGNASRAARFDPSQWPTARIVRRRFGTFAAALEQAGTGTRPVRNRPLREPDEILRAIRAWTRLYGEPPTQADWDPARARTRNQLWRVERFRAGDWPSLVTTRSHFGSLSAAIEAAGLEAGARWEPLEERSMRDLRNVRAVVAGAATDDASPRDPFASHLREVVAARQADDAVALRAALVELAEESLRWAHRLRWDPGDTEP
jgi:hypothetical protein